MEKNGLVERRVDEHDQRFTRIYLTPAGWAMHDQVHGIFDEMDDAGLGTMSEKDRNELARLLGELNANLQAAIEWACENGEREIALRIAGPFPAE